MVVTGFKPNITSDGITSDQDTTSIEIRGTFTLTVIPGTVSTAIAHTLTIGKGTITILFVVITMDRDTVSAFVSDPDTVGAFENQKGRGNSSFPFTYCARPVSLCPAVLASP